MVIVVDSIGVRHQLVLHAFSTKSASAVGPGADPEEPVRGASPIDVTGSPSYR